MPIYGLNTGISEATTWYYSENKYVPGDHVFVNTQHGGAVAAIATAPITPLRGFKESDLPVIIRSATEEDMATFNQNRELAKKARDFCRERIKIRKLDMKLVNVEIFFDRSKFIFYFTAPGRIDFRELVKDLVAEYRARIELRQIGVRHETQMTGAVGHCGQLCCCRRYLRQFAPVTIRMAKDQRLFLNPSKISGMCGRLLCCLSFEQDTYEKFLKAAPRPGRKYATSKGQVKILNTDMFKETIRFLNLNNEEKEISLTEWQKLQPQPVGGEPAEEDEPDQQTWE